MLDILGKRFDFMSLFDPAEGMLVRAPLSEGAGWWAGAPSATFDSLTNTFYLVYRMRQPRDMGRGVELRIASSENGISFTDIWALPKSSLLALSLERATLMRGLNGKWQLFFGHVDPSDNRWRISMVEADEPDQFNVAERTTLLTAQDVGGEGVKDPNVFIIGRMIYMLASYARTVGNQFLEQEAHSTADIYSTGLIVSRTGAAVSGDGKRFQWIGDVSPVSNFPAFPSPSAPESLPALKWDSYCRRIGSLLPLPNGGYIALYDGGASKADNYEEKTGLAMTFDLRTFYSLSPDAPALTSPHGSGSLRYVDILPVGHEIFYYYEIARPDGGHELHVSVVERDR
ncbi:MAG: hypothetical protein NT023_25680 [Armatimonadetes bacterium]|nr:hypothetical protein [Armatimonadota bacterium]